MESARKAHRAERGFEAARQMECADGRRICRREHKISGFRTFQYKLDTGFGCGAEQCVDIEILQCDRGGTSPLCHHCRVRVIQQIDLMHSVCSADGGQGTPM
jgi:hypothetical protein